MVRSNGNNCIKSFSNTTEFSGKYIMRAKHAEPYWDLRASVLPDLPNTNPSWHLALQGLDVNISDN